jgi:hypothetical protein
MVRKRGAEQRADHRRQCDEQERQCPATVIAEFDAGDPEATIHALADEILKYRRAMRLLAKAIGWADVGESTLVRVYVLMGLLCGSAAAYAFLRLRLRLSKEAS